MKGWWSTTSQKTRNHTPIKKELNMFEVSWKMNDSLTTLKVGKHLAFLLSYGVPIEIHICHFVSQCLNLSQSFWNYQFQGSIAGFVWNPIAWFKGLPQAGPSATVWDKTKSEKLPGKWQQVVPVVPVQAMFPRSVAQQAPVTLRRRKQGWSFDFGVHEGVGSLLGATLIHSNLPMP